VSVLGVVCVYGVCGYLWCVCVVCLYVYAAEVIIRSGKQPVGEWIEEEVNAYEDFKQIHQHEPATQAWGISLLGGPGVEIDFGTLEVSGP